MTHRLAIRWPDARPFRGRDGRPIRLLAVSDEIERTLREPANRDAIGPVDGIIGCGDLEPDELAFVADAFCAPLLYVRGNHDVGMRWTTSRSRLPDPSPGGRTSDLSGIGVATLPWPGIEDVRSAAEVRRDDWAAWRQALKLATGRLRMPGVPVIVASHVPPRDAGDDPEDPYHRGFEAYRWLMGRIRPPLWLHGHTTVATVKNWQTRVADTVLVNATGAVLIEIGPPD